MGKITDIKQQQRRENRVIIYVDDSYAFSLSIWQLSELKLKVGQDLNHEEIEKLTNKSEAGKLYDKTINWLAIRPRSRWEIAEFLDRKSKEENLKNKVLTKLDEKGHVNDAEFAQKWIQHRRLLKPMSTYRIKQELIKKRVPRELIDQEIEKDETSDVDTAVDLILKKRKKYSDDKKLMAYLSRQGFHYGTIKEALDRINEST